MFVYFNENNLAEILGGGAEEQEGDVRNGREVLEIVGFGEEEKESNSGQGFLVYKGKGDLLGEEETDFLKEVSSIIMRRIQTVKGGQ